MFFLILQLLITDEQLRTQLILALTEDDRLHVDEVARLLAVLQGGVKVDKLAQTATVAPALNQCSHSVSLHDDETAAYCDAQGIVYMSYSPLCGGSNGSSCQHGSVMHQPQVQAIAKAHGKSAAQVALKWLVQQGRPLATAVAREDFAREDLDLWSWGELSDREMRALAAI